MAKVYFTDMNSIVLNHFGVGCAILGENIWYKLSHYSTNLHKLLETLMSMNLIYCMPGACNSDSCSSFSVFIYDDREAVVFFDAITKVL